MNIEFGSEPVYGDVDKHLKAKMKLYGVGTKVKKFFKVKKYQKKMHHMGVNH